MYCCLFSSVGAISCGDIVEAIQDEDAAVEFCQNFDLSREGQIG
jgi:hypothetical protein